MPKAKILYQSKEEIYGKHLRAKEWIEYSGKITLVIILGLIFLCSGKVNISDQQVKQIEKKF